MSESPHLDATAGKPSDQEIGIAPPQLSLPKGGAIRGMGEKFAANPVTGTGSLAVPIYSSPGRSRFGPQLSLSYDSGSGNSPFGFGWSIALPAISRISIAVREIAGG
jgi:Salmonella virulence plasmid 65kDa B protein